MHPPIMSLWGHLQKVQQFFEINFPLMTLLNGIESERERDEHFPFSESQWIKKKWFPVLMKYENIFRK